MIQKFFLLGNIELIVETCRLRTVDPWGYISQVFTQGPRGIKYPLIPVGPLITS